MTVPAVVISEWWRGRSDAADTLLRGVRVELFDTELAKLAGEAIAVVPGSTRLTRWSWPPQLAERSGDAVARLQRRLVGGALSLGRR